MSGLLGYFSWDKKKPSTPSAEEQPEKQQPVRALPASWYTSPNMYQFERRAIFADRWLFMTSTLRLPSPNTYVRYQFAGYDILIVRDQDGLIKALHNKSRATKEILIDDTTQEATGIFDASVSTSREDVFPIHVHIDRNGFIWVNLDASSVPSIPFATYFKDVDIQARYAPIDFTNYTLHHIYTLHTSYNWKAAADNFNECYHCPTTHPDIPSFLNLESFDSDLKDGHIQHACAPSAEQIALGVNVHSTYYFPNVSMTVGIHFLMIQKFLPRAADGTVCHYEIFKAKGSSDEEFHRIADMYERVMREDKVLCENAQRNLERGVFEAGLLHPRYEKAPIFFQAGVREAVRGHWERERRAGRSLWPARQPGLEHGAEEEGGKEESRVMGRDEGAEGLGGGVQKEVLVW